MSAEDALIAQHASLALKRVEVNMTGVRGNQTVKEVAERTSRTKGPVSAQVSNSSSLIAYCTTFRLFFLRLLCNPSSVNILQAWTLFLMFK